MCALLLWHDCIPAQSVRVYMWGEVNVSVRNGRAGVRSVMVISGVWGLVSGGKCSEFGGEGCDSVRASLAGGSARLRCEHVVGVVITIKSCTDATGREQRLRFTPPDPTRRDTTV